MRNLYAEHAANMMIARMKFCDEKIIDVIARKKQKKKQKELTQEEALAKAQAEYEEMMRVKNFRVVLLNNDDSMRYDSEAESTFAELYLSRSDAIAEMNRRYSRLKTKCVPKYKIFEY
jgi:hypothetical protein